MISTIWELRGWQWWEIVFTREALILCIIEIVYVLALFIFRQAPPKTLITTSHQLFVFKPTVITHPGRWCIQRTICLHWNIVQKVIGCQNDQELYSSCLHSYYYSLVLLTYLATLFVPTIITTLWTNLWTLIDKIIILKF